MCIRDRYTDDLISREELNDKLGGTRQALDRLENELKMVSSNLTKGDQMEIGRASCRERVLRLV